MIDTILATLWADYSKLAILSSEMSMDILTGRPLYTEMLSCVCQHIKDRFDVVLGRAARLQGFC